MTCGLIAFLASEGHATVASATYQCDGRVDDKPRDGRSPPVAEHGLSGDRPDDSARSDVMVVGQSGQCRVLPPLPTSRTEPDPSERVSRTRMATAAASLARPEGARRTKMRCSGKSERSPRRSPGPRS